MSDAEDTQHDSVLAALALGAPSLEDQRAWAQARVRERAALLTREALDLSPDAIVEALADLGEGKEGPHWDAVRKAAAIARAADAACDAIASMDEAAATNLEAGAALSQYGAV